MFKALILYTPLFIFISTQSALACAHTLEPAPYAINKTNLSILMITTLVFIIAATIRGIEIHKQHPKRSLLMFFISIMALLCPATAYFAAQFDITLLHMMATGSNMVTAYSAALLFSLSLYSFSRYHFQKISHHVEETDTAQPIIFYLLASLYLVTLSITSLSLFTDFKFPHCYM